MDCPKCGFAQPDGAGACACCGLIFARYERHLEAEAVAADAVAIARRTRRTESPEADAPLVAGLDQAGRRALPIGAAAGLVLFAVPFLNFLASYLSILVHELGHAIAAWLFGYPAVPAFDFCYGGGVTIYDERNTGLLILIGAGFAALVYVCRRHRALLVALGGVGAVYVLLAFTSAHQLLQLGAGHGSELLFAGIFLFRAMTGVACVAGLERPVYASVGSFMVLKAAGFGWRLATSEEFRAEYEAAKGGGGWMDFSLIARQLDSSVASVATMFALAAVVTPLATWAAVLAWRRVRS